MKTSNPSHSRPRTVPCAAASGTGTGPTGNFSANFCIPDKHLPALLQSTIENHWRLLTEKSGYLYFIYLFLFYFIFPLFNQVGKLRISYHLQLRPGQDEAKQFDRHNDTELHME